MRSSAGVAPTPIEKAAADTMKLETLHVRQDGPVLFADIGLR
jgi:hypothetical protein